MLTSDLFAVADLVSPPTYAVHPQRTQRVFTQYAYCTAHRNAVVAMATSGGKKQPAVTNNYYWSSNICVLSGVADYRVHESSSSNK